MKRNSLIFMLLAALFMPLVVNAQGLMKAPRGTALQAVGVQNSTRQETPQNRDRDGWLQYDDGNHVGDYGLQNAYLWEFGSLYPSSMLGNNNTLSKVSFWENTNMYASYGVTVNVYSPDTTNLLYQETFDLNGTNGMHEVELSQPVTFNPSQDLWITITVAGTYVFSVCQSNEVNNDWVDWNGWRHGSEKGLSGLGWMIRGYVEYVDPTNTCLKPTGLTVDNVTNHTATLSWTSDATSWQICVNDNESNLITTNQNPYTLTNLNPETEYSVKIRAKCSNTQQSNWTSNVTFTTDVACPNPVVTVAEEDITSTSAVVTWTGSANNYNLRYRVENGFNYGFETAEPWAVDNFAPCTTYDGDGLPTYGISGATMPNANYTGSVIAFQNGLTSNVTAHSGNACGGFFNGIPDEEAGVTANDDWFILPEITIARGDVFSFWAREFVTTYGSEVMNVGIYGSTDGTFSATLAQNVQVASTDWEEYSYNLSAYAGQTIRLAINCVSSDVFALFIDDIFVGNPNTAWPSAISATSPYSITGLIPATSYEVQVQAVCGGQDGSSEWVTTVFTTLPACYTPELTVDNITTTSATLTWTGNALSYQLLVNGVNYDGPVSSPLNLTGLTAATEYTLELQGTCSATGTTSAWASTSFWTDFCEEANKCEISYVLTDSYGDGWNGAYLLVVDVETNLIIDYWTVPGGDSIATGTLPVCDGREILFYWYSGNYDDECSYVVTSPLGEEILNGSDAMSSTVNYTVTCALDACDAPAILPTEPSYYTANLSWNGNATTYRIRYREAGIDSSIFTQVGEDKTTDSVMTQYIFDLNAYNGQQGHVAIRHYNVSDQFMLNIDDIAGRTFSTVDFENGIPEGWILVDNDGDGHNWYVASSENTDDNGNYYYHSATHFLTSASYDNNGHSALTPDNWFISPYITLRGSFSIWARGQDINWAEEVFGVYVTTEEVVERPWITVNETVSGSTYTLTGLNPLTTYEFQIQAADATCTNNEWSSTHYFTTTNDKVFGRSGYWNVGRNWLSGTVPPEGADVVINATAIIPAGYDAIVNNVTMGGNSSITIEDGGQLHHGTSNLEVTMKKNIPAYSGTQDNYKLLAFPFSDYYGVAVPEGMTAAEGNDFYEFNNGIPAEEWQNNRITTIEYVYPAVGYLYANPTAIEISMTGSTFASYEHSVYNNYTYNASENEVAGWKLLGNPFTCNAYIYNGNDEPMDVMYYDANGNIQTISAGPVAPMQGFFVKITEDTRINFMPEELSAKSKASHAVSLDKKTFTKDANKPVVLNRKTDRVPFHKGMNVRFDMVKPFIPVKK